MARFSKAREPRLEPQHISLAYFDEEEENSDCDYIEEEDDDYVTAIIPYVGCGTGREVGL